VAEDDRYPCPCCGYITFSEGPGSYAICGICFWEDDASQLRWPDVAGGANQPSLLQSQRNYLQFFAMEQRFAYFVRSPDLNDRADVEWRLIDPEVDHFEPAGVQERPWPADLTVLYWWRPTFWRHP
jgi:cysteine-rich CPCC protein